MRLPESLLPGAEDRAAYVLREYYRVHESLAAGYTGAYFDAFDPSGTRLASQNSFTADDLVAVTFLSVEVPPRAAQRLLVQDREEFTNLLVALGPDRDFARELDVSEEGLPTAWDLWRELMKIPDLGPTTVSKLMARKRPRLIPIFDSVIKKHVLEGSDSHWGALHEALNAHHSNGESLHGYLTRLHASTGLRPEVTTLRIFDVLAWMDGKGYSERLLAARYS